MSDRNSKLWVLAPPVLIVITVFVYYAKYHWARTWIDERSPWVKEHIGSRLPSLVIGEPSTSDSSVETGTFGAGPGSPGTGAAHATTAGETAIPSTSALSSPANQSYLLPDGRVDFAKLAADRTAWPSTVKLKKKREFPVVINGKQVGKVEAPIGTETRLVTLQGGHLGLEFRGGGAWVPIEETDLAKRLGGGIE